MMGININDKRQAFTVQISELLKDIETRNTPSLRPYVGKRVGIIRTGIGTAVLIGYVTISAEIYYPTVKSFRADYKRHRVAKGSYYDIKPHKGKYGYIITDFEACEPTEVHSKGIIARSI